MKDSMLFVRIKFSRFGWHVIPTGEVFNVFSENVSEKFLLWDSDKNIIIKIDLRRMMRLFDRYKIL
jgi:hypothetical protein